MKDLQGFVQRGFWNVRELGPITRLRARAMLRDRKRSGPALAGGGLQQPKINLPQIRTLRVPLLPRIDVEVTVVLWRGLASCLRTTRVIDRFATRLLLLLARPD